MRAAFRRGLRAERHDTRGSHESSRGDEYQEFRRDDHDAYILRPRPGRSDAITVNSLTIHIRLRGHRHGRNNQLPSSQYGFNLGRYSGAARPWVRRAWRGEPARR